MDNFHSLYHSSLERIKPSGQNQYVALCPFHEDRNPSFSFNTDTGLHCCHSADCGRQGNAYQFAVDMGANNPKQYIEDSQMVQNAQYFPKKENVQNVQKTDKKENTPNLDKMMAQYRQNLKDKWDELEYKDIWEIELIDKIDIGIDNGGVLQFAHHDINGQIICIRTHKSVPIGEKQSKWYLRHEIGSYRHDKEIYICEGEKDATTLYSKGEQVTSSTTGCGSIPKNKDGDNDLEWLRDWKADIFICYDNDDSGIKGAKKLAKAIAKEHRHLNIKLSKWDKGLEDKYDVYDAFINKEGSTSGKNFWMSISNAESYELPSSFHWIGGADANSIIVPNQVEIIEKIMPKGANIVLGGTTGANKSYMAMQWGMSLVSNAEEFLGYKINVPNQRVLYVDTECGKDELLRRYQRIQQFLNWDNNIAEGWAMISPKENTDDIWIEIDNAITRHRADAVFIDCLYNITNNMDISKNHNISRITKKIDFLKRKHEGLTPIAIHHTNKGGHEEGLYIDRLSGGSALQNWIEHCIMITTTNEAHKRMMRFAKSRVLSKPTCYYELHWNDDTFKLTNEGIIDNPKSLLVTEEAKKKWDEALNHMQDEFTWNDWLNKVEVMDGMSQTTAKNWMSELRGMEAVERVGQGIYRKKRKLIKDTE